MNTTADKIKVMEHFEAGGEVDLLDNPYISQDFYKWHNDPCPDWDWVSNEWRIKPAEPKTIYVNEYRTGSQVGWLTKAEAIEQVGSAVTRTAIPYREVIDGK